MRNWSPLTTAVHQTSAAGRSSRRGATIRHVLVHATAGGTVQSNLATFQDGTRVSCNYFVGGGSAFGIVPEHERAHTSGSPHDDGRGAQWDRESLTIECLNYLGPNGWTVRPDDYDALVRLTRELTDHHRIPRDRLHIIGHRELWTRHRASYPTECPAGIDMPTLITDINEGNDQMTPEQEALLRKTAEKVDKIAWLFSKSFGPALGRIDTARWKYSNRDLPMILKKLDELAERGDAPSA